jgi:hypothetical protein
VSNQDPNSFLLGGGGKSAKFENVGDVVEGTIAAPPELRQQTDIATGAPKTWDNGDPVQQLVVQLQTDAREDVDDDGIRNLYVAGGFKRASLQKAIADAVKTAKAPGLAVGGHLAVKFTGEEPPQKKGFSPAKLYAAKYTPPTDAFLAEQKQPEPVTAGASSGSGWDETPF